MRQVWHQMFLRLPMADSVQRAHKDRSSKTRAKQSKHKRRNVCYIQSMWSFQHRRRGSFCLSQDLFCPAPLLWTYPCGQPPPCYSCRNLQVQNSTCFAINGLLHRCIQSWSGYHSHERNSTCKGGLERKLSMLKPYGEVEQEEWIRKTENMSILYSLSLGCIRWL